MNQNISLTMSSVSPEHDPKSRIRDLMSLIESDPANAPAHAELGYLYYECKEYDHALQHFEKAVRLDPGNVKFQRQLGDFYYTVLSRSEDALAAYMKALEQDPLDSEINLLAGNLLVVLHRFDEAGQLYQNILNIEPWRGDVQDLLDQLAQRRMDKTPRTTTERHRRAQRLAEEGQAGAAIKVLEEIVAQDPRCAAAHNDLGVLKHRTGEVERAGRHYEMAVSIDGDNFVYKKNLAEYRLFVNGEIEKALELYLDILKSCPQDVDALLAAGDISGHFQRYEDAKLFYEAVLDIEPWNLSASQGLSRVGEAAGIKPNGGLF